MGLHFQMTKMDLSCKGVSSSQVGLQPPWLTLGTWQEWISQMEVPGKRA